MVAYVEIRDADFGVSRAQLETQLGPCRIEWVNSDDLRRIDGECHVLVCQTPIPVLKFFSRSRIVAQQYSLAKERYQYGVWRAQADLNLMYGTYSSRLIEPFARSMATGNPLFDGHLPTTGLIEAGAKRSGVVARAIHAHLRRPVLIVRGHRSAAGTRGFAHSEGAPRGF